MSNPVLITVGTINNGATAIQADVSSLAAGTGGGPGPGDAVAITLSTDYAMLCPASFPSRPSFTGCFPVQNYPHTIVAGTTFTVLRCEAAPLVTAGAATYA